MTQFFLSRYTTSKCFIYKLCLSKLDKHVVPIGPGILRPVQREQPILLPANFQNFIYLLYGILAVLKFNLYNYEASSCRDSEPERNCPIFIFAQIRSNCTVLYRVNHYNLGISQLWESYINLNSRN